MRVYDEATDGATTAEALASVGLTLDDVRPRLAAPAQEARLVTDSHGASLVVTLVAAVGFAARRGASGCRGIPCRVARPAPYDPRSVFTAEQIRRGEDYACVGATLEPAVARDQPRGGVGARLQPRGARA